MIISISGSGKKSENGKQIELSQNLQNHVKETLENNIKKYFDNPISATVHFSRDSYLIKCEIIVNGGIGDGTIINANFVDKDISHAFHSSLARIKTQLKKYHSRLKKHNHIHKEDLQDALINATKYVISSSEEDLDEENYEANPVIITEKPTQISYLTVKEAVMRMDLLNLPALMFKNRGNGKINLVYYRKDGNISWIDPKDI